VGSGFVVAHLPNGDWSAPAFFKWHAAGGGITLGARLSTVNDLQFDLQMLAATMA
jgi:lipid-binding SYLF domain-containing protein